MPEKSAILVLNGPNLNKLGQREPSIYGTETLADVEALCRKTGDELGLSVDCRQSNHEGQLVEWIQESGKNFKGIVINAGAYSHTSIAILDALKIAGIPAVEVHLSNIFGREEFRHHSFVSAAAKAVICGMGADGYALALRGIKRFISQ
jgi:3-dehydroquinate dehydratase-2